MGLYDAVLIKDNHLAQFAQPGEPVGATAARAVRQALDAGARVSGVTVHFVDEQVDHGPVIAQRAVVIQDDDDEESLHARIQAEEHELYPLVVKALAAGRLLMQDGKVRWI